MSLTAAVQQPRALRLVSSRPTTRGTVERMAAPISVHELAPLMADASRGDQQAFAQLYDATSRNVFGIVLRVLRDHAQAEEITQEVYVEAWRLVKRFDSNKGSVSAWLNTMAHRRAVDRVRSAERRTQREHRHFEFQAADVAADPADLVVANDEGRRVRNALAQLSEGQRTAVELAYFQGKTQREVAEYLQVPLGTVKTRIRDAMQRLRKQLGEAAS